METEMLHAIDTAKSRRRPGNGKGNTKTIAALATELEKKINFTIESIKLGLIQINDENTTEKDRQVLLEIVMREIERLEPVQSLIEYQWPSLHSFMCDLKKEVNGQ